VHPEQKNITGNKERIVASLKALASGDAIGKQTETLRHSDVRYWYPDGISGFHGRPGEVIPRYAGNSRYEWRIGETTDDTEQTVAVARAMLHTRGVSHTDVGRELLKCSKSVHPDLKSIWTFQRAGDPSRIASEGDGCGAAMRVSPVGMVYSLERFDELVGAAYESSIPTHGGQFAICAAAAVAGAVSAAVEGRFAAEVLNVAIQAARAAEIFKTRSERRRGASIADRIREMHEDLSARATLSVSDIAQDYFPDKPETKVPLAINLALITESAEQTILLAANVGGDADSVASIGAGIAGALRPDTVNEAWFDVVQAGSGHDLIGIAHALAELRC
jgi:ADP-ribosylglycohydrolase